VSDHEGRAGIVTGASSGLGRVIALTLGAGGMDLWLVGRSASELEVTAEAIRKGRPGAIVHCYPLDIANPGALAALVTEVGKAHPWLAALVNCAGIIYLEPLLSAEPERWRALFDINVLAPLEACQAAVAAMRVHGLAGNLINISSIASRFENYGAYGASKAALEMLGRTLRGELEKDNIRVTTIIPGGFKTRLGRDHSPSVRAKMAASAASKGQGYHGGNDGNVLGNPDHVAALVDYILRQPSEINFEEVTIRPPVSISY
jgi:NAD(P)-dependent dehydrogenase (short-subunit alcohol dehydrogenase family)